MTEKEIKSFETTAKPKTARSPNLALWQAIALSAVAVLAVAVGTIYGTILS